MTSIEKFKKPSQYFRNYDQSFKKNINDHVCLSFTDLIYLFSKFDKIEEFNYCAQIKIKSIKQTYVKKKIW